LFSMFLFPSPFLLLPLPYRYFGVPEKEHEWKRSIAANKAHFLKPMFSLNYKNVRYHQTIWAVKSHSPALAIFQNIVKTIKQREPIWIMCVPFSYSILIDFILIPIIHKVC